MFIFSLLLVGVLGSALISALMPKPPQPKPADISDFDAPTAEEGRPIPVIFGTVKVKGANVLWYGGLYNEAIEKKQGKK